MCDTPDLVFNEEVNKQSKRFSLELSQISPINLITQLETSMGG